jgi:FG-GAP repeat/Bacterial Ig domain
MRPRSPLWLWCLPLALVGGCLLPSFENVPADVVPEGGSDSGGSTNVVGGAAGQAPEGGVPAGGSGSSTPSAPKPLADTFVVQQGKSLKLGAAKGVLSNDTPRGLSVSAFSDTDKNRPKAYNAAIDIAADGSVTFTPAAAFFGRYYVDYTVQNAEGETATATATFIVQPLAASLSTVADGIGGALLVGSAGDGLGQAVTALGDVNADGFDDFAIGAPGAAQGAGAVYVVFGSSAFGSLTLGALAGSSRETRFAVLKGGANEHVGSFIASAGRFDSDKVPDILVGSPATSDPDGSLYVAFGGAELKTSLALDAMPKGRGIVIGGQPFTGQKLGSLVAGGGDFNGDQKADLLAGFYEAGDTTKGACLILENPVADSTIDLVAHKTVSDGTAELPSSLVFAGDVTGDGKDDILASSLQYVVLLPGDGNGDLVTAITGQVSDDGTAGGYKLARPANATLAAPVAPAGDVNGDKKADLAYCDVVGGKAQCEILFGHLAAGRKLFPGDWSVSGFGATPGLPYLAQGADVNQDKLADLLFADESAAYLVFGRDTGFDAVDVGSLGGNGFSLTAPAKGKLASVATIGDVNGDGYADFAAADPTAGGGVGHVYVVFGGPFAPSQR